MLLQALVGFLMDGKIPLPETQFDSERVRYEHRLLPFSSLMIPPAADYQKFYDLTNSQIQKKNVSLFDRMSIIILVIIIVVVVVITIISKT